MSGIEIIIGSIVYVTSNAILAGILMLLKKYDGKKFLAIMDNVRKMSLNVDSLSAKNNNIYELLTDEGTSRSQPRSQGNEPYPDEREVIYLDELIKHGKLSVHGYELILTKTPR